MGMHYEPVIWSLKKKKKEKEKEKFWILFVSDPLDIKDSLHDYLKSKPSP